MTVSYRCSINSASRLHIRFKTVGFGKSASALAARLRAFAVVFVLTSIFGPGLDRAIAQPFPATVSLDSLRGEIGVRLLGERSDTAGSAVANAGDVNGDGLDDLIIGAPGYQTSPPNTYVLFGSQDGFPSSVNLADLLGSAGFRLDGAGSSVNRAGDVNGDGVDDLIVSDPTASPDGLVSAGSTYVVFGHAGSFVSPILLDRLGTPNGFRLNGGDGEFSGTSVAGVGDVNGDGLDDLLVGGPRATVGAARNAGRGVVVFGRTTGFPSVIALDTLTPAEGAQISGVAQGDRLGESVAGAGDVNCDGIDDVILGARSADPNGIGSAGSVYVVFGRNNWDIAAPDLSALNGLNGFRLDGVRPASSAGRSVSAAGDVNGDGVGDIILGADGDDPDGLSAAGSVYVVFGRCGLFPTPLSLADIDGVNGFRLDGVATNDFTGGAVSAAGDVNGDGIGDVIVGVRAADSDETPGAGLSYVVFGRRGTFPSPMSLASLTGENGFRLAGTDFNGRSGAAVSTAGDLNGDGRDDVVIGEPNSDAADLRSGAVYVLYGRDAGNAGAVGVPATNSVSLTLLAMLMLLTLCLRRRRSNGLITQSRPEK